MLYKYKPDNDYTLAILEQNEIWLSFPNEFNDPFDSKMVVIAEGTKGDIKKWAKRFNYPKKQEILAYENMLIESKREEARQKIEEENQKFIIVYCLTPYRDNQLMWSHYSNSHRGICIGFQTEIIDNTDCIKFNDIDIYTNPCFVDMFVPAIPVEYIEKMPKPYNIFTSKKEDVGPFLLSKPKFWEYEQEKRLIITYPQYSKNKFTIDKNSIKEVILGCKCTPSYKNQISSILKTEYINKGFKVSLLQARCARDSYNLEFDELRF